MEWGQATSFACALDAAQSIKLDKTVCSTGVERLCGVAQPQAKQALLKRHPNEQHHNSC